MTSATMPTEHFQQGLGGSVRGIGRATPISGCGASARSVHLFRLRPPGRKAAHPRYLWTMWICPTSRSNGAIFGATTAPGSMTISLAQQIDEIDRELEQRREVYPRLAASRGARQSVLDFQIARLEAARATLQWLKDNALIRQRLNS